MLHDDLTLEFFRDELHKLGAPMLPAALTSQLAKLPGRFGNMALSAGSMAGVGGAAGAAIGGGIKGVQGYRDARAQGATAGQAAVSGLAGGAGGALRGAQVGALAGGLGGAALSGVRPELAEGLRRQLTERSALSRFGQRQVHGFTGITPAQGLGSLRMDASQRAQDLGLTNLPGVAKSIKERGILETGREAFKGQLQGAGAVGKTMAAAGAVMPLAMSVRREEGETGGHHALRAAGNIGRAASGVMLGNVPFAAQQLLEHGVGAAAGRARRLIPEGAQ